MEQLTEDQDKKLREYVAQYLKKRNDFLGYIVLSIGIIIILFFFIDPNLTWSGFFLYPVFGLSLGGLVKFVNLYKFKSQNPLTLEAEFQKIKNKKY